jgi:hypothetical protein
MTLDNVGTNISTNLLRGSVAFLIFLLAACGGSFGPAEADAPVEMTAIEPTTPPTEAPAVDESTTEVATPAPPAAEQATPAAGNAPTPEAVAEAPQLSFTPATYTDESAGFALDYPSDWTLDPSSQIGVRGGQALLLSPGTTIETLPDGGTRVAIVTYVWDPKNDLDAYIAQRKVAWDASGFAITREEAWELPDGRAAYVFEVNTPETPTFMFFTTVGEDYLQIAGEGDQALIEEIARTFRPLN